MQYRKTVSRLNDRIVRIACAPKNRGGHTATFAVKDPERFEKVRTRKEGGRRVAKVGGIEVRFVEDGKPLNARNLAVSWDRNGQTLSWKPGQRDWDNLGGVPVGLDALREDLIPKGPCGYDPMKGFDAHGHGIQVPQLHLADMLAEELGRKERDEETEAEVRRLLDGDPPTLFSEWPAKAKAIRDKVMTVPPGYLSRSGLTIIRDDSLPWDTDEDWPLNGKRSLSQIIYLIHYETDYKLGLQLISELLGPIPPIPEWQLGVWFSVFRPMGEKDWVQLKEDFDKHELPLDVFVVDTDWHALNWHGFDWNPKLFPDPERFRKWKDKNRLHAAFNVHPYSVPEGDTRLSEFYAQTGVEPNLYTKENAPNQFLPGCQPVDLFDKDQAAAWFEIFHHPIEEQGCDTWWVDGYLEDAAGHDATAFMNELYYRNTHVGVARKLPILSRGYGMGSHRSTLLFTGDTFGQWPTLEEEVRVTARAGNKLWAHISHDIGGFFGKSWADKKNKPPDDLFVRWTQFGCLSPIMRFHSDHGIREPWRFKKQSFEIIRRFLWLRQALRPYLLELANRAHECGLPLCRPMYYEHPDLEVAYEAEYQYFLGEALLFVPVVREDSRVAAWIPPGRWHHAFLPRTIEGPCWIEEEVPLEISPLYVKEGVEFAVLDVDALRRGKKKPIQYEVSRDGLFADVIGFDAPGKAR